MDTQKLKRTRVQNLIISSITNQMKFPTFVLPLCSTVVTHWSVGRDARETEDEMNRSDARAIAISDLNLVAKSGFNIRFGMLILVIRVIFYKFHIKI